MRCHTSNTYIKEMYLGVGEVGDGVEVGGDELAPWVLVDAKLRVLNLVVVDVPVEPHNHRCTHDGHGANTKGRGRDNSNNIAFQKKIGTEARTNPGGDGNQHCKQSKSTRAPTRNTRATSKGVLISARMLVRVLIQEGIFFLPRDTASYVLPVTNGLKADFPPLPGARQGCLLLPYATAGRSRRRWAPYRTWTAFRSTRSIFPRDSFPISVARTLRLFSALPVSVSLISPSVYLSLPPHTTPQQPYF